MWYENGRCALWSINPDGASQQVDLGLIVSEVHFIPSSEKAIVRHADGRAYWLDLNWFSTIYGQSTEYVINLIRDYNEGPASSPWWTAGHPGHHPWPRGKTD